MKKLVYFTILAVTFFLTGHTSAQILTGVQYQPSGAPLTYSGSGLLGETLDVATSTGTTVLADGVDLNITVPGQYSALLTQTPHGGSTSDPQYNLYTNFISTVAGNSGDPNDPSVPNPNTFTFSGLTPGSLYNVAIYGGVDSGGTDLNTSIGGSFFSGSLLTSGLHGSEYTTFTNNSDGNNYLIFDGVTADIHGDISFTQQPTAGDLYSGISGVGIESAVPEPSTYLLLGVGSLALFVSQRRRMAS